MKKGQVIEGRIEKVEFPNKGLVWVSEEERYVTVKNGIPGQKIRFVVNKFKKGNAEGRLLEVLEKSPLETREPVCSIFPACGGCMYQTMGYEEQLKMKAGQVKELLDEVVKEPYENEGIKVRRSSGIGIKWSFPLGMSIRMARCLWGFTRKGVLMMC